MYSIIEKLKTTTLLVRDTEQQWTIELTDIDIQLFDDNFRLKSKMILLPNDPLPPEERYFTLNASYVSEKPFFPITGEFTTSEHLPRVNWVVSETQARYIYTSPLPQEMTKCSLKFIDPHLKRLSNFKPEHHSIYLIRLLSPETHVLVVGTQAREWMMQWLENKRYDFISQEMIQMGEIVIHFSMSFTLYMESQLVNMDQMMWSFGESYAYAPLTVMDAKTPNRLRMNDTATHSLQNLFEAQRRVLEYEALGYVLETTEWFQCRMWNTLFSSFEISWLLKWNTCIIEHSKTNMPQFVLGFTPNAPKQLQFLKYFAASRNPQHLIAMPDTDQGFYALPFDTDPEIGLREETMDGANLKCLVETSHFEKCFQQQTVRTIQPHEMHKFLQEEKNAVIMFPLKDQMAALGFEKSQLRVEDGFCKLGLNGYNVTIPEDNGALVSLSQDRVFIAHQLPHTADIVHIVLPL